MQATPENDKAIAAQILCAIIRSGALPGFLEEKTGALQTRNLESTWARVLTMVSSSKAESQP